MKNIFFILFFGLTTVNNLLGQQTPPTPIPDLAPPISPLQEKPGAHSTQVQCVVPDCSMFTGVAETVYMDMTLSESYKYKGMLIDVVPNGIGTANYDDGRIYTGFFINGRPTGKGTKWLKDGTVIEGDFINGRVYGVGKITFPNQEHYEGYLENDTMHGFGTLFFPNGEIFTGNFYYNYYHLYGVLKYSNGQVYMGGFKYGYKHGRGVMIDASAKQKAYVWIYDKPFPITITTIPSIYSEKIAKLTPTHKQMVDNNTHSVLPDPNLQNYMANPQPGVNFIHKN